MFIRGRFGNFFPERFFFAVRKDNKVKISE